MSFMLSSFVFYIGVYFQIIAKRLLFTLPDIQRVKVKFNFFRFIVVGLFCYTAGGVFRFRCPADKSSYDQGAAFCLMS